MEPNSRLNSKLKIENVNNKQYGVAEVMNQGYYAYVDEEEEDKGDNTLRTNKTNKLGLNNS